MMNAANRPKIGTTNLVVRLVFGVLALSGLASAGCSFDDTTGQAAGTAQVSQGAEKMVQQSLPINYWRR